MQFRSVFDSSVLYNKMLKLTAVLFVVSFSLARGAALSHEEDDDKFFSDRLRNVINKKCMANAGEAEYNNAIDTLETFRHNWSIALPEERLFGVAFYNYCITEAQNFTTYLITLIDTLLPCLTPEEEFLKPFLINSYGDYNHYLCKFMELLTVSESKKNYEKQCQELLDGNDEINPYYACYKDSKIFGDNATSTVITKRLLCEDILEIRCCYDKIFGEHCLNVSEFGDLRRVLLTQSLTHCVDELESSEENSSEKVKSLISED